MKRMIINKPMKENTMVLTMSVSELLESCILISYNISHSELRALIYDACLRKTNMILLLQELGFTRDGVGRYWRLPIAFDGLEQRGRDLSDILHPIAAWDAGKVFAVDLDTPLMNRLNLPEFWSAQFAIEVRSTGHYLLFERDADDMGIRQMYMHEYEEYLLHEFHPSE